MTISDGEHGDVSNRVFTFYKNISSSSSAAVSDSHSGGMVAGSNGSSILSGDSGGGGDGGEVVNCSLYYNYSLEETDAESSIPCTDKWSSLLSKYSFATEGVGLFTVAIVGELTR